MRHRIFLFAFVLASLFGCSFLLNVDPDQCKDDGDCVLIGPNRACRAGQCVRMAEAIDAPTGAEAEPPDTAVPPCDPVACSKREPASICNFKKNTCEPLITNDCRLLLGKVDNSDAWRDPRAVIIAAVVPEPLPTAPAVQVIELAVSEINGPNARGLPPLETGGLRRPLAVLVCDDTLLGTAQATRGQPAAQHVFNRLGLPAMLWHVGPDELAAAWTAVANPAGGFMLNAGGYTRALEAVQDDRMWHLLPSLQKLAEIYGATIHRMEESARQYSDAGTVRMMTLTSSDSLSQTLREELAVNRNVTVNDAGLRADSAAHRFVNVDDTDASVAEIVEFDPHLVVSTVGTELIPVVQKAQPLLQSRAVAEAAQAADAGIEGGVSLQERLPRYLFSPFNKDDAHLDALFKNAFGYTPLFLSRHVAGVNAATTTTNGEIKSGFQSRFDLKFGDAGAPEARETENVYDAVYFIAYAVAAATQKAKTERPSGADIGQGMKQLFVGERVEVGPLFLPAGFEALRQERSISLEGTLGSPTFDSVTRAKDIPVSAFCVNPKPLAPFVYQLDVLYLGDGGASDGGTEEAGVLVGDWPGKCPSNTAL